MRMRFLTVFCTSFLLVFLTAIPLMAAKLEKPPRSERWFGIHVDNERVGFYRQAIVDAPEGYRFEGDGSVRMRVMGFSKEASVRENYLVGKNLALISFSVEQTVNGSRSLISGRISDGGLRIRQDSGGKVAEKLLKFKGDLYPGPALNLIPLMRDVPPGKVLKVMTFDPEESKVKEVRITLLGPEKTPDGQPALKLRNNLYPFVNNDIWVDSLGNTLIESVREGLVVTRAEEPKQLGAYVGGVALAKKDLIYDFSLVRAEPPLTDHKKLTGLALEIRGWNDALPLMQGGGQAMEKRGEGSVSVRTGSLAPPPPEAGPIGERYLKPAEKIESDAPEIVSQSKELSSSAASAEGKVKALAAWTADWLQDTVEDGGSAVASFKNRTGNCQTHARLYTALARAAGIPTRFVSGLVYLEGKGFLYHSWAESIVDGKWVSIDPTYNQVPADVTHIKLFEGHLPEDMIPIIAIIGRIHIKILETKS